jgi:hypothetical protein
VTTNVTLHAGHDVRYFTAGQNQGGFAGAMSYYTAAGEPAGEWAGKGAAALGLAGPGVRRPQPSSSCRGSQTTWTARSVIRNWRNRRLYPDGDASRMNEQRARENSAYVRKLLSEREPEFAAALAAAERCISWSFRPGGDEDRDDDPYAAIPVQSCSTDGHAPGKQTAFVGHQREHSPLSAS